MTAVAENYELARAMVNGGGWTVDLERGVVLGKRGQPFRRTNTDGYIQIKHRDPADWRKERHALAHRVIWEHVHGPLSDDVQINHIDGNKKNNRIGNLEAVTGAENCRHAYATGLNRPSRPNARLTADQAVEVYRRCHAGEKDEALAAEFGLKAPTVNNIRNGWAWEEFTGHVNSTAAKAAA